MTVDRPLVKQELLPWYITFVLFLAVISSYLDRGIISLLTPSIKSEFNISDVQMSLVQGLAFYIAFSIASIPVGIIVDRFNRRNVVIAGVATWSVATICCGLVQSYGQLFAARVLVGIGEACLMPAAFSIVSDCFRFDQRGRPMGLLMSGATLGGSLSTVVGGMILALLDGESRFFLPGGAPMASWRLVFLAFGLLGLPIILFQLTLREPRRTGDPPGVAPPSAEDRSFLAHARPDAGFFISLYTMFGLNFLVGTATAVWIVSALGRTYGIAVSEAGVLAGVVQLCTSVGGSLLGGVIGDLLIRRKAKFGRLGLWFGVIPLIAVGGALLFSSDDKVAFVTGFALVHLSNGLLASTVYAGIHDIVPASLRGQSVSYCAVLANFIGVGLGPTLPALITDQVFHEDRMLNSSLGCVTLGVAALMTLLLVSICRRYASLRLSLSPD